ncbi:MAG: hypothetical protein LBS01_09855 [Prevotellaceae bacterium]|nr:hypothetical protein [Prevotellaceae bacterium]
MALFQLFGKIAAIFTHLFCEPIDRAFLQYKLFFYKVSDVYFLFFNKFSRFARLGIAKTSISLSLNICFVSALAA